MLKPIQAENELICPGCGCVLQNMEVSNDNMMEKSPIPISSTNMLLLGSAMTHVKFAFKKSSQEVFEENVIRNLDNITKKYGLPQRFVIETFQELKRRKRGFQSENEPIKVLLKILSKDDNYQFIKTYKKIKARYEEIINY